MGKYSVENQDEYLFKHNLLSAASYKELEQLEIVAFSIRSSQLEVEGFEWLLPLTIETFKKLHYSLFQDIYPFAGQIRDVQLIKDQTRFCQAEYIETNIKTITDQLQNEQRWGTIEQASERLAYYKTELNIIHPFREGNGRTLRITIREIARSHGFDWDFQKIEPEIYMRAMILSVRDETFLINLLKDTLNLR